GVDSFAARFFGQTLHRCRIGLANLTFVVVGLNRLSNYFELLARRWAVDVHGNQQWTMPTVLEPVCQLARGGGLAGSLQSRHEYDGWWLGGKFQFCRVAA